MKAYKYVIKIKDRASKSLRNVANRAGITSSRLKGMIRRMKRSRKEGKRMAGAFLKLGRVLAGVFIVGSLTGFLNSVVNIRSEFEKYEAVLSNTFQSATAGQTAMNFIKDFAEKTPFQLNELTGAYVKLVNRGFVPTAKQMTSLGDLASSQGKSFGQLTEAILDAETSEFERLKEFGIKASKAGDKITFSFKGVTKTVNNNAASLRKAIIEYGNMTGVAGSMEVISKTLGGRISNLKDKWDNFLNQTGKSSSGVMVNVIELLNTGIDFLTRNLNNISAYFSYLGDTIISVVAPFKKLAKDIYTLGGTIDNDLNPSVAWLNVAFTGIAFGLDLVTTGIASAIDWFVSLSSTTKQIVYGLFAFKSAMWLVNLAMMANPVSIMITGIVVLMGMIGLATKYTTGWGKSWIAIKSVFSLTVSQIKADFNITIEDIKHGFNAVYYKAKNIVQRIVGIFKNMGAALKLALGGKFKEAWSKANESVVTSASKKLASENEAWNNKLNKYKNDSKQRGTNTKEALGKFGIVADYAKIAKDFNALKSKFKNASGEKTKIGNYQTDVVDKFVKNTDGSAASGADATKTKGGIGGITGGGKRISHITVNLQKLQDKTEIHTVNYEDALDEGSSKLIEMLLRVLNSANQLQGSIA